ncbi:MAG: CCA tRNA nucleotidyltransferase [Planctomycetales bacterium]|nr:CCA tRNA nucleotidyltransferase [Planctomycetales bacterium]
MSNREAAYKVVRRLRKEGYEALFAGGCVRDRLLGRPASDYDVVTDAVPDAVIKLFRRALKIGAKFGVVMVLTDGKQVEVATFRTEGGYQDGRHPGHVEFASAKEDAARRDFTVNGMFYDPIAKEVLDFVSGRKDLQKRILRTIGSPDERFSEDFLRMLRAVRFAVKLGFCIEPATWRSIQKHASKISGISAERIAAEIEQILSYPDRARGAQLLIESGLAFRIFDNYKAESAAFGKAVLEHLPPAVDFPLALAAFWADLPVKEAVAQCAKLKLSNDQTKHVRFLLEKRGVLLDAEMPVSRLKLLMHEPYFWDLIALEKAIAAAAGQTLRPLKTIRKRALDMDEKDIHPAPLLDGHELIALGAVPGPRVGQLAQEMYIAQLEGQIRTRQQARTWCLNWLGKHAVG